MQGFRKFTIWLIVAAVVLFVAAFMVTYTVRFTEVAVRTRWGKAQEVDTQAGLKWKIPGVDFVVKYDKRSRFKQSKPETQQTRDERQVIATAYLTWRVADANTFYERFSGAGRRPDQHYKQAEDELIEKELRSALSEISSYRLNQLLSMDMSASKLPELEERMQRRLNTNLAAQGIEVTSVGLTALELPASVTSKVSERMKKERERIAQRTKDEAKAIANEIKSTAEKDATKILAFANTLAGKLRSVGEQEAATYIAKMSENQELAVWQQQIEFLRRGFGARTTLVFNPTIPGFELLGPGAFALLREGRIPPNGLTHGQAGVDEATTSPAADRQESDGDDRSGETMSTASQMR